MKKFLIASLFFTACATATEVPTTVAPAEFVRMGQIIDLGTKGGACPVFVTVQLDSNQTFFCLEDDTGLKIGMTLGALDE